MEYVHHLLSVIVPSMITVLVIFIVTILYRARRTLLIRKDSNSTHQKAEKIPQENDERFATVIRRRRGSRLSLPCILTTG